MSSDWQEETLGDLIARGEASLQTGPFGTALKAAEYTKEGAPLISVREIRGGFLLITDETPRVSDETISRLPKCVLQKGDIVFGRKGGVDRNSIISEAQVGWFLGSDGIRLRLNDEYDPCYFSYIMRSTSTKAWLLQNCEGSTMPSLNQKVLSRLPVKYPELTLQRNIGSVLKAFDEKIHLNGKINQTLEQMAQAIFKSWFVDFEPVKAKIAALEAGGSEEDAQLAAMQAISGSSLFDADASAAGAKAQLTRLKAEQPEQYATLRATAELFPSAMQDSELGEIPEGWSCLALDKIAQYQNGLALQKFRPENEDDYLPVVKIAQLKKGYADGEEKASPNIKPECIIDNGDVVFSWSGSLMVDTWCGGKAALNQHLFKVTSKAYPKWLYFHFTKHHLEEFQRIAADKAVTMGHIKREHLKTALCAIPGENLLDVKGKVIGNILDKQIELRLEAKSLSQLRDTLLPRLLSGELSLADAERRLSEAAYA